MMQNLRRPRAAPLLPAGTATDTTLLHADHGVRAMFGTPNPPVFRTSTVLFDTLADFEHAHDNLDDALIYGRIGTPTTWALEDALSRLAGAETAVLTPSGVSAIYLAILSQVSAGDHILLCADAYSPTRKLCEGTLARSGVSMTVYDGSDIRELSARVRDDTTLIYLESPTSNMIRVLDVEAIIGFAKSRGIAVICDDTWATPMYSRSLELGASISVHAATKYIVGHSDAMMGVALASGEAARRLIATAREIGLCVSGDDAYLALRGLRTLAVRIERQAASALSIAEWLCKQQGVGEVFYPPMPKSPDHALWQKNFKGACGVLSFRLIGPAMYAAHFVDALRYFAVGASWGGYESLVRVFPWPQRPGEPESSLVRLSVGLEACDDLLNDLACGLAAMPTI